MDVVAYDRRGFGTTTDRAEAHDQVVDLLAVLDALALDRVVLVGNSRGRSDRSRLHADPSRAGRRPGPGGSGCLGRPGGRRGEIDPVEAAIWDTLDAADAAGASTPSTWARSASGSTGPHAPEGRVDGPRRQLALDMNRVALHADSPGHEPAPPVDAWSRLAEVRLPGPGGGG